MPRAASEMAFWMQSPPQATWDWVAAPSFCDPALLDKPMIISRIEPLGIPYIHIQYAENSSQMQPIREQSGTFADSIKLWSAS